MSSDHRRFIGRKAACCRKCGGRLHYVNRMGGIVCEACCKPATGPDGKVIDGEVRMRLVASGDVLGDGLLWDDADNPFEVSEASSPSVTSLASHPPSPQPQATPQVDWRLLQQDPASRQSIVQAAEIQGVSVTEWFDAVENAFTERSEEFGWSSEPTWVRMDRLMQRVKKCGLPVVW